MQERKTHTALVIAAVGILLTLAAAPSTASDVDEPVVVEPGEAVIQVDGIVCSFCAYGAEKSLSRTRTSRAPSSTFGTELNLGLGVTF